MKIYDKKLKYHRGEDSLNMSIRVFKDLCPKAGVRLEEYRDTFSTMLAGEASEFYYQKLTEKDLLFNQMVEIMRSNFETKECQNRILNWWNTITLTTVQSQNPDKTILECFEILRRELIDKQLSLRDEMHSETTI